MILLAILVLSVTAVVVGGTVGATESHRKKQQLPAANFGV
jgi:hypothetical protein